MSVCDRHYNVHAQVCFSLDSGGILYGCGHCAREWGEQMVEKGVLFWSTAA